MAIGDPITEVIPAVGTAGTQYATELVAYLNEVKARLEEAISLAIVVPAPFDASNNPLYNLQYAGFYESTAVPSAPVGSLHRYAGNLWYVSPSGAFQVTNGASLNATAVKGFTGDYGSPNPAEARFVDADQRYNFYDDYGTGTWGIVRARHFDVAAGATSLNRVRFAFGGVADYTLTLPAAVPGSQVLLQMTNAGALVASNTLPTNTDIVLSGTGKIQHGDRTISVPIHLGGGDAGPTAGSISVASPAWQTGVTLSASTTYVCRIHNLPHGARVKTIKFWRDSGGGSITYAFGVNLSGSTTLTPVAVTGSPSTAAAVTITVTTPATLGLHSGASVEGTPYFALTTPGGVTCTLYNVAVTYDIPA